MVFTDDSYVQTRLRLHGESVAFFGGCARESEIISSKYDQLLKHQHRVVRMLFFLLFDQCLFVFQAKIQWIYGAVDDFVIKQLPHIVTWGLSLAYTNRMAKHQSVYENHGSQLGHDLRYVASAVSHTFMAFGDLLDLYKRFVELGGYLGRVSG